MSEPPTLVLERVVRDLSGRVGFALIGGLAVSTHVAPRFTKDIDLAVAVATDAEAEALVVSLRNRGYYVDAVIEQEALGRLATVRLLMDEEGVSVHVDLLFASSGIEAEIVAQSLVLDVLPRLSMPVARAGHLCVLKLLATNEHRPQDALDLHALSQVMDDAEWLAAEQGASLIETRGYHRGRDLRAALRALRLEGR